MLLDAIYKNIIVLVVIVVATLAAYKGQRGIRLAFMFAVWAMAVGYRTIRIGETISFHPSELMIWYLMVLILLERPVWRRSNARWWMPWWVPPMLVFCVLGWFMGLPGTPKWEMQFAEFKVFLLLIPFFGVASIVLRDRAGWNSAIVAVFAAGVWIGGLGLLEYFIPSSRIYFKGFMVEAAAAVGEEGFLRAPFTFWGSPDAVYVCMVSIPLLPSVWSMSSSKLAKVAALVGGILLLVGVYISGHRSAWLLFLLIMGLMIILRKGVLWGGGGAILVGYLLLGIAGNVLPEEAAARFQSGISVIEGQPTDGSGKKRWGRAEQSIENIGNNPFGRGWAASGWVHSDFLMVTENLGIPAGLFFLTAFCVTFIRMFRLARSRSPSPNEQNVSISLMLSLLVAGWLLAFECTLVLVQLVMPVWTAWILAETWLHHQSESSSEHYAKTKSVCTRADLQLIRNAPQGPSISKLGR